MNNNLDRGALEELALVVCSKEEEVIPADHFVEDWFLLQILVPKRSVMQEIIEVILCIINFIEKLTHCKKGDHIFKSLSQCYGK